MSNGKLIKGNIKSIGITAELHEKIKALAERDDIPIYELMEKAVDRYERWTAAKALLSNGDDD